MADRKKERDHESDTRCGCGPCKPSLLQCFAHPVIFTGHAGLIIAVLFCANTYFNGILTTLERQFQLSSSEVGALTVLNDISSLCVILFVTYFGQKSHRPRWVACGGLIIAIGLMICAVPHFVSDPIDPQSLIAGGTGTTRGNQAARLAGVCVTASNSAANQTNVTGQNANNSSIDKCQDESAKAGFGPVQWIINGQIIVGCGSAPLFPLILSYIDDAVKKHKFTSYTAFMFIAITIGPIVGFLFTSKATSLYVDFDRVPADLIPDLHQYDPRWIGAWWLGFPIFSIVMLVFVIPMFFYPSVMIREPSESDDVKDPVVDDDDDDDITSRITTGGIFENASGGIVEIIKGLLQSIKRLFSNVPLMLLCIGSAAQSAVTVSNTTFGIKYLQIQFGTSPAAAALLTGGLVVPCITVSQIVSAVICRKFKLNTKQCAGFVAGCHVMSFVFMIVQIFVGCGNLSVAGINTPYTIGDAYTTISPPGEVSITPEYQSAFRTENTCNNECACADEVFRPVCGADGVSYISPCLAGCFKFNISTKLYSHCTCVRSDSDDVAYNTAVPGLCRGSCKTKRQLTIFMAATLLEVFFFTLIFSPQVFVTFRLVKNDDRPVALGLKSVISKCLAFFPAPILMGLVINSTCILWQYTCGDRGSCWLYDTVSYRYLFHGISVALKFLVIVCYGFVYLIIKPVKEEEDMVELQKDIANAGKKADAN